MPGVGRLAMGFGGEWGACLLSLENLPLNNIFEFLEKTLAKLLRTVIIRITQFQLR